jgi:hypothetical protein
MLERRKDSDASEPPNLTSLAFSALLLSDLHSGRLCLLISLLRESHGDGAREGVGRVLCSFAVRKGVE